MKQPRGLFITGTDTGVGKTAVAAGLAAWCRFKGIDAGVMKPFATGAQRAGSRLVSEDALLLKQASGVQDPCSLINPVCLKEPLAPWVAAKRAGQGISIKKTLKAYYALSGCHDFMVVEGVGGILVPLTQRLTIGDFAKKLNLPVVIVARPGLGTINHTLLSVLACRKLGLTIAGIIINHSQPAPKAAAAQLAIQTNPDAIQKHAGIAIAGILPYHHPIEDRLLSRWIEKGIKARWLKQWVS